MLDKRIASTNGTIHAHNEINLNMFSNQISSFELSVWNKVETKQVNQSLAAVLLSFTYRNSHKLSTH